MSDCVFIAHLDEDYAYSMALMEYPDEGEVALVMQIPFDNYKQDTLDALSPIFEWAADTDVGIIESNKRKVTIRKGKTCWILTGAVFKKLDCFDELEDEAVIYLCLTYDECCILRKSTGI